MKNKIVLALMQLKGISRKTILKSFRLSSDMECTIDVIAEAVDRAGMENGRVKKFSDLEIQEAIEKADQIIEDCQKNDIAITTYLDKEYPKKLMTISDAPTILYYKGDIQCLNELNSVAIIGTRQPTDYGMRIAKNLGASFGKRSYVVVSGLALGCDTGGHEGCLEVNGKTVAVMAGGLDKVYPAKNKKLAERILEQGGALISEYPPYTDAFKNFFVERDRLQSGLSDGVLVVETGEKGGTLHTAQYCLDYQRVLACYLHPEKYLHDEKTFGNQKLISEGKAMAVGNDAELKAFRNKMEKQDNDLMVEGVQRTIFDFLDV